jgi:hypothetical protein
MAVMWPVRLPNSILEDSRRGSEVRVYKKLEEVLDDEYHVFYSSPWLGEDSLGYEKDGECDFLVAHPSYGILAVEVKGGEISYDPDEDQWRSKDRNNFTHKIKDPVAQARSSKHQLLNKLNLAKRWKRRFIFAAHGVIFPHAAAVRSDLGADRPAKIFCCSRRFNNELREWVVEMFREGNQPPGCQPLGQDGISALERLLAHPFTLSFKISAALSEAENDLRILEPSQYQVLDTITDIKRALIRGGAGTGKTIIAMEAAIRSAQSGKKTLLSCYSRPLALSLQRRLKPFENLTVAGFHSLCGQMAHEAGIELEKCDKQLYEHALPNVLFEALEKVPSLKWDTVIIDEAQDFRPEWWIAIDECLRDNGELRIIMDSNQNVYDQEASFVNDLSAVPVRLARNLRNTKRIHEAALVHYLGLEIIADGPEGLEVVWVTAESMEDKIKTAHAQLKRLVFNEEVAPSEIAVLFNGQIWKNKFLEHLSGTAIPYTDAENSALEDVIIDTVRRFKGLERSVVIFVLGGDDMENRELAYVALSRARTYLNVISSASEKLWLSGNIDND